MNIICTKCGKEVATRFDSYRFNYVNNYKFCNCPDNNTQSMKEFITKELIKEGKVSRTNR